MGGRGGGVKGWEGVGGGGGGRKSRTICVQQNNIGTVSKATLGTKTGGKRDGARMGFSRREGGWGGGGGVGSRERSVFSRTT